MKGCLNELISPAAQNVNFFDTIRVHKMKPCEKKCTMTSLMFSTDKLDVLIKVPNLYSGNPTRYWLIQ